MSAGLAESWYLTPEEEARAVGRAALRAGCRVTSMHVGHTVAGMRAIGRVVCEDGWGAARMLLALAHEDARTPGARAIAWKLRQAAPSDAAFAHAIQAYVKARVRFVPEEGEVFQNSGYTLAAGYGDCDDHARPVYALAIAGGLPAELVFLHHGWDAPPEKQGPTHALAALCPDQRCSFAETTVDARYGEHPVDAAIRLGVIKARADLAREVVTMTEKDLAPVPGGFRARNAADRVSLDAQALERLGYLPARPSPGDPEDPVFRRAVLAFQLARGITADGLTGPETRGALAAALREQLPQEGAIGELANAVEAPIAAGATARTAHLSREFFRLVAEMGKKWQAKGAGVGAEDFLAVWLVESGIKSKITSVLGAKCGGLNGMCAFNLPALGWPGTYEDWIEAEPEEQLPYVERFYLGHVHNHFKDDFSRVPNVGTLYLMNFYPRDLPHANEPEYVLVRRDPAGPAPGASAGEWQSWRNTHKNDHYAWNLPLDVGGKGYIEVDDMRKTIEKGIAGGGAYWAEVKARLAAEGGLPPEAKAVAGLGTALGLLLAAGTVGAAYVAYRAWG